MPDLALHAGSVAQRRDDDPVGQKVRFDVCDVARHVDPRRTQSEHGLWRVVPKQRYPRVGYRAPNEGHDLTTEPLDRVDIWTVGVPTDEQQTICTLVSTRTVHLGIMDRRNYVQTANPGRFQGRF